MKMKLLSTVSLVLLVWVGTANANLITNGDFEESTFGAWQVRNEVSLVDTSDPTSLFNETHGMNGQYAFLGGATGVSNNRLWQDFDVTGLSELHISFDWVMNYVDISSNRERFISIVRDYDGTSVGNITLQNLRTTGNVNNIGQDLLFGTYSGIVDISSFSTPDARLQFRLAETAGVFSSVGVDDVKVAPIPEPATMLLFGTGLAGLVAARRKKSKD